MTIGLPLRARDTVGCDTPARCAISSDVGLPLLLIGLWVLRRRHDARAGSGARAVRCGRGAVQQDRYPLACGDLR